jgi:hypothetical protein
MPPMIPFFARRWRGEVGTSTVFWRDMLGVGTVLNLLASFVALVLSSHGAPPWLPVAVHFAPLPYNVLLFRAVLRSKPGGQAVRVVALIWLVVMVVV